VRDTIVVTDIPPLAWEKNIALCNIEKYKLDAGVTGAKYRWSTGDTTQIIDITAAGSYWVEVNTNACILSDTVSIDGSFGAGELWFPNSFTPNGDLLNDYFTGKGADITYFQMMIFNRWGDLIFETEKQDQGWNGAYKGNAVEQDVYVWKVKYKTVCTHDLLNTKIGQVNVIR
jgi:gliding motility-associated-like protein